MLGYFGLEIKRLMLLRKLQTEINFRREVQTLVNKRMSEIEQKYEDLKKVSYFDELTNLYNRRGFISLVEKQLQSVQKGKEEIIFLFCDIDNMKWINDTLGHIEGDQALIHTARILKTTFRESEIIARLGGDEFIVALVVEKGTPNSILIRRLEGNTLKYNSENSLAYTLILSIGSTRFDPYNPCSLEELIKQADTAMYQNKKRKKLR